MADASSRQTRGVNHAELVRVVTDYLAAIGAWYFKAAGGAYQVPGLPDLIGCLPPAGLPAAERGMHAAEFFCVELKTGKADLTGKQREVREAIERACGLYILAHSVDEVEDALVAAGLTTARLQRKRGVS